MARVRAHLVRKRIERIAEWKNVDLEACAVELRDQTACDLADAVVLQILRHDADPNPAACRHRPLPPG
jgi:hypothetical protein